MDLPLAGRNAWVAGKARFIGVTGLPLAIFRHVLARTELDTILSTCHYSLNDSNLAAPILGGNAADFYLHSKPGQGVAT